MRTTRVANDRAAAATITGGGRYNIIAAGNFQSVEHLFVRSFMTRVARGGYWRGPVDGRLVVVVVRVVVVATLPLSRRAHTRPQHYLRGGARARAHAHRLRRRRRGRTVGRGAARGGGRARASASRRPLLPPDDRRVTNRRCAVPVPRPSTDRHAAHIINTGGGTVQLRYTFYLLSIILLYHVVIIWWANLVLDYLPIRCDKFVFLFRFSVKIVNFAYLTPGSTASGQRALSPDPMTLWTVIIMTIRI